MSSATKDQIFFEKYKQEYPLALAAFQSIQSTVNEGLLKTETEILLSNILGRPDAF